MKMKFLRIKAHNTHSTYAIELGIDQFWSPDTGDYKSLRLDAGKHDISLQFEGRAPGSVNLDQPYIKQMSFWKGKLTSNTLTIDVASMNADEQARVARSLSCLLGSTWLLIASFGQL